MSASRLPAEPEEFSPRINDFQLLRALCERSTLEGIDSQASHWGGAGSGDLSEEGKSEVFS